ncbi:MAG: hypothetical protein LRZ88_06595 [Candidatus Cloacimonetes bacterium]|nr:hypothetical protein [Candidatus Cloacimonadota bacterium]
MIEMGELREGIKREGLIPFYKKIFKLSNLDVVGIGTNLGCMYGIQPTYDKLIQLVLYEQLIEAKFKRNLELVSGAAALPCPSWNGARCLPGSTISALVRQPFWALLPWITSQSWGSIPELSLFEANIVELYKKSNVPDGTITDAAVGHTPDDPDVEEESQSFKAIMDFGVLDVDAEHLVPEDPDIRFFGNSSDLTVYDLGDNPRGYKTGDVMRFELKYMAVAKLMYSRFVEKVLID